MTQRIRLGNTPRVLLVLGLALSLTGVALAQDPASKPSMDRREARPTDKAVTAATPTRLAGEDVLPSRTVAPLQALSSRVSLPPPGLSAAVDDVRTVVEVLAPRCAARRLGGRQLVVLRDQMAVTRAQDRVGEEAAHAIEDAVVGVRRGCMELQVGREWLPS